MGCDVFGGSADALPAGARQDALAVRRFDRAFVPVQPRGGYGAGDHAVVARVVHTDIGGGARGGSAAVDPAQLPGVSSVRSFARRSRDRAVFVEQPLRAAYAGSEHGERLPSADASGEQPVREPHGGAARRSGIQQGPAAFGDRVDRSQPGDFLVADGSALPLLLAPAAATGGVRDLGARARRPGVVAAAAAADGPDVPVRAGGRIGSLLRGGSAGTLSFSRVLVYVFVRRVSFIHDKGR